MPFPTLLHLFILHSKLVQPLPLLIELLAGPGPQLDPLCSGQVTFFPNHSHEDPGRLEGLSLPAEIPPGEAIRFGRPEAFRTVGTGARVGHQWEEIEVSHLWSLQPSASSRGGEERWAGGRQPRGSGRHRPSGGEHWAPRRGCRAECGGRSATRVLTSTHVGSPPPGSSRASSCATHPVAQRMPSSWTTCAPLFCSTCGGSCPGISWTLLGPRPHLPCVRSVGSPC